MAEYKSNSFKSREAIEKPKREISPVINKASVKKTSEVSKFLQVFFPERSTSIKSFIIDDVVIPTVKNAIADSIEMVLFPNGRTRAFNKNNSGTRVNYGGYYRGESSRPTKQEHYENIFDYDQIIFDTRQDADKVLFGMDDVIDQYGFVTVLDLFDLSNITTSNYMAEKYGWTDIRSGNVVSVRGGGWSIKLPRPRPLD